jgi:REP element-mobilizing transposase RayT
MVQLPLPLVRRGRKGAGRPPKGARSSQPHKKRERFRQGTPILVTLRTVEGAKYLRNRHTCDALRRALRITFRRDNFRICQISVQTGHIHLLVEADDHLALARGMQAFQISAAQHMNRAFSRRNGARCRGRVFADRYHARLQRTPRQMRNSIRYVVNNWRRHREDRDLRWPHDPYSSAATFTGFATAPSRCRPPDPAANARLGPPLDVSPPSTWLLRVGWLRAGGPIDPTERPGRCRPGRWVAE